jgi:hypothetical protein
VATGLKVECYAGYKANQKPTAFALGKKKIKVEAIVDQWYGPDHTYFKVLAEDTNIYILRYGETNDRWELVLFEEGDYHGEVSSWMGKNASS